MEDDVVLPEGVVFEASNEPQGRAVDSGEELWWAIVRNGSQLNLDEVVVWAVSAWGPHQLAGCESLAPGANCRGSWWLGAGADLNGDWAYATFVANGRRWRVARGDSLSEVVVPVAPPGIPDEFPADIGSQPYILYGTHFLALNEDAVRILAAPADDHQHWRLHEEQIRRQLAGNPGGHWLFGAAGVARLSDRLLFRYMGPRGFQSLLEKKALTMKRLSSMNDPRESRPWVWEQMVAGAGPGIAVSLDDHAHARECADAVELIRQQTLQVCFGQQRRAPLGLLDPLPRAGFLQPRMWAQYGRGHEGVCVVFDRRKLDLAFAAALAGRRGFGDDVIYSDDVMDQLFAGTVTYDTAAPMSPTAFVEEHRGSILFVKSPDWQSEHEYRWVLLNDDPPLSELEVPIAGCVLGLVLGDLFNAVDDAWAFADAFDIGRNVARCVWSGPHSDGVRVIER